MPRLQVPQGPRAGPPTDAPGRPGTLAAISGSAGTLGPARSDPPSAPEHLASAHLRFPDDASSRSAVRSKSSTDPDSGSACKSLPDLVGPVTQLLKCPADLGALTCRRAALLGCSSSRRASRASTSGRERAELRSFCPIPGTEHRTSRSAVDHRSDEAVGMKRRENRERQ